MPGKRTYILWNIGERCFLDEEEISRADTEEHAGRFTEGAALDIITERANIADPSKGIVLMLSPECRSL